MPQLSWNFVLSLRAVVPPQRDVAELVLALMAPEILERSASDQTVSALSTPVGTPTVSPFPVVRNGSMVVEVPTAEICTMADLEVLVDELDQIDATLSELR